MLSGKTFLNAVGPEDVINLVIADQGAPAPDAVDLALEVSAGDPTVAFNLTAVAAALPTDVAVSATAGDPTVALAVTAVDPVTTYYAYIRRWHMMMQIRVNLDWRFAGHAMLRIDHRLFIQGDAIHQTVLPL